MPFNFNAVMGALSAYEDKFVDILTTNAMNTFVYTSLGDINQNLRRGVIADELHDTRLGNIKKLDADAVSTLKDHLTEKGRGFVDSYHDDLMKGGRFVNVGQWGAPDSDGVHPYIGYERKWVPWLEQYNQNQRAAIGDIITSGKMKDDIRADLNTVFKERKVYSDLVARTEVGNNANIIRRDRYIQAGYNEFMWVCSPSTNSPCQIMCAQFCGKIYTKDNLPMNGEKAHARCKCVLQPAAKSTYRGEYDNLDVASSSAKGKELISQGYKVDEKYPSVIKMNQNIPGIKPIEKIMPTSPVDITKPVTEYITPKLKSVDDLMVDVQKVYDSKRDEYLALKAESLNLKGAVSKSVTDRFEYVQDWNAKLYPEVSRKEFNAILDGMGKNTRKLTDEWESACLKLAKYKGDGKKEIQALLEHGLGGNLSYSPVFFPPDADMSKINAGVKFVRGIAVPDIQSKISPTIMNAPGREAADYAGQIVKCSPTSTPNVVAHELGHLFEVDPVIFNNVVDFYERRTKGEVLSDLGGAMRGELTKKDKFINTYTGKLYQHSGAQTPSSGVITLQNGNNMAYTGQYATEVLSTGLEHLYTMPGEFAAKDPDHFKFMMKILRGEVI